MSLIRMGDYYEQRSIQLWLIWIDNKHDMKYGDTLKHYWTGQEE